MKQCYHKLSDIKYHSFIKGLNYYFMDFLSGSDGKVSAYSAGDLGSTPGSGRSPGEGMAIHSSILAWKIPWTEEPGGLQSMGTKELNTTWWLKQQHVLNASLSLLCIEYFTFITGFFYCCWFHSFVTSFLSTKKISHSLKLESHFIWWECLGPWAQETASQ